MKKILPFALLALTLAAIPPPAPVAAPAQVSPIVAPSLMPSPSPSDVWLDRGDIRELAQDGDTVWVATSGGLVSIDLRTLAQRAYGTVDGLDTLDVRHVRLVSGRLAVDTAMSRCEKMSTSDRFRCRLEASTAAEARETETFAGHAVSARLKTERGELVGTRGAGLWLGTQQVIAAGPGSFAKSASVFRGALWLGLFDGGIVRVALVNGELPPTPKMQAVTTPFRMVNDLLEVDGAMFVAANEGLYVCRDGKKFDRVASIGARSITGLAADARGLWLTSTESLYRIDRAGKQKAQAAYVHPAGSHSVQGLALAANGVWLATEDRGVVWFDGKDFHAKDKLAGLPTSWIVGVTDDGAGGVFAATLRDGALHVGPSGEWEHVLAAGAWGESASRVGEHVCFGTQEGASCGAIRLRGLPDPRVHAVFSVGRKIIALTEAGIAVYDRA